MTQTANLDKAKTIELTLFLEWPDVVIFVVLLTSGDKLSLYREKLEWVGQKLVKVKMVLNSAGLPIDSKLIY
jgi:L-lysine 2,3-aminomutase